MANKNVSTRIKMKFATLSEWQTCWNLFVPLKGEICKIQIPANAAVSGLTTSSAVRVLTKTGDGVTTLEQLPWDSALSANVALSKSADSTATKTLTHGSTFIAVTDTTVSGLAIKDTTTTYTLPAETAVTIEDVSGTTATTSHGGTINVVTAIDEGDTSHELKVTTTPVKLPTETSVSVDTLTSGSATLAHGGTFTAITSAQKGNSSHNVDVTPTTFTLPAETTLSKGTDEVATATTNLSHGGTFNVVTDTKVSGHVITDVITPFKLPSETAVVTDQLSGTTQTLTHGGTVDVITGVVKGNSSHNIDVTTTKLTLPAETSLSKGTNVVNSTATTLTHGGTFTVGNGTSVDGHTITDNIMTYKLPTLPAETAVSVDTLSKNTQTLTHGGTFTVLTSAVKGGSSHNIDVTPTEFTLPSLPTGAMIFKGTLGTGGTTTSLPASPTVGWCYKVITAGTYGGQSCTYGDMLVYSEDNAWVLIPSGDDEKVGTVTNVATGQGLSGGPITTTGTIKHVDVTRSDTTSTQTASHAGTIAVVDGVTTNSMGHVTGINVKTVTLPGETSLSKGTDEDTTASSALTHGGTFKVVTDTKVSGHQLIDVNTTFTLPSETAVSVDTLTAGTKTLTHGGTFTVLTAAAKGNSSHNIDVTPTTFTLPAAPTDKYHTPSSSSGIKIATGTGVADLYVPTGSTSSTVAVGNHTHSNYVNQNAFSNVTVGSTTVAADTATDTLTLVAGSNVTITPDATNDKITIAATDTNYSAGSGLSLSGTTFSNSAAVYFLAKDTFTTTAGNSTSGSYLSTKWSVPNVDGITTPFDGMKIAVRVPAAGVSTAGIVLSINGTSGTYYPVVRLVNTAVTTNYAVNSTIILTFNATETATAYLTSNTKTTVTGCWQIGDYDANTKTTTGTSNKTATKLYLAGATSQSSSGATTYSNKNCYVGTDNCLYSNDKKVSTIEHTHTVSHTPAGTVSTPTITVTPNTTTVNSITAVGSLPSLTYSEVKPSKITAWSAGTAPSASLSAGSGSASLTGSVSTGPNRTVTLTFSHTHTAPSLTFNAGTVPSLTYEAVTADNITAWSAGTLPTKGSNTTVVTSIKSATSTQPTFTGTAATLTTSADNS